MKAPWRISAVGLATLLLPSPDGVHGLSDNQRLQVSSIPPSVSLNALAVSVSVSANSQLVKRVPCVGLSCLSSGADDPPLPPPTLVFRGDRRDFAKLQGEGGFYAKGLQQRLEGRKERVQDVELGCTLLEHAKGNAHTRFISTSRDADAAAVFTGPKGHLYLIRTDQRFVDLDQTLGKRSPYPEQQEISAIGHIPIDMIVGWWEVEHIKKKSRQEQERMWKEMQQQGTGHAEFKKNDEFHEDKWRGKKSSGIQLSLAGFEEDLKRGSDPIHNLDKFVKDEMRQMKPGRPLWDFVNWPNPSAEARKLGDWHKELLSAQGALEQAKSDLAGATTAEAATKASGELEKSLDRLTAMGRTMTDLEKKTPSMSTIEMRWDELESNIGDSRVKLSEAKTKVHVLESTRLLQEINSAEAAAHDADLATTTQQIKTKANKITQEAEAMSALADMAKNLQERLKKASKQGFHDKNKQESAALLETPGIIRLTRPDDEADETQDRETPAKAMARLLAAVSEEVQVIKRAKKQVDENSDKATQMVKWYEKKVKQQQGGNNAATETEESQDGSIRKGRLGRIGRKGRKGSSSSSSSSQERVQDQANGQQGGAEEQQKDVDTETGQEAADGDEADQEDEDDGTRRKGREGRNSQKKKKKKQRQRQKQKQAA